MTKGTIHNKESFLNEIAGKLGRERQEPVVLPEWKHQPQWQIYQESTSEDLLAAFVKNGREKDTNVITTNRSNLPEAIQKVIKEYGGGSIVTTKDARFPEYGLSSVFDHHDTHIWDTSLGKENIKKAKDADIGVIFSDISLAESGSIIQFNDKDIARSVSLLPTTYIAIVAQSSIVPRMTQATKKIHEQVAAGKDIASCINIMSGPSNSADIEMDIVVGVHGPVKAVYIVVEDK